MSRKETVQISCPNCGRQFQKDVWTLINVDTEPYLKTALVTGLLNLTRCPKCNYEYFLALPLVYHEASTKRVWCYIPAEMGKPSERELLAVSMVEELRQDLNTMLRKLGKDLTITQTETAFSYLQSPRIFDAMDEMVEEIRQVENSDSIAQKGDATAQLLIALESLQNVDSDEKFVAALEAHSIFSSPETPAHLRGLSELAKAHGDDEKAEYFNSLAEVLERAMGIDAEADELLEAIAAIAEVSSEEELDAVFLAHPILSKSESIGRLRYAAAEIDDENTAQFYSDVADMLEERQFSESPPGLEEALQAFVEADSPEEHIALIKSYPILHSPEAIAHLRHRAEMAHQAEEEDVADFFENLVEMMERVRNVEMDENARGGFLPSTS
ncbi:MAG: CpXC domain-containing protein [Candidatus Poribacteria bacterium]